MRQHRFFLTIDKSCKSEPGNRYPTFDHRSLQLARPTLQEKPVLFGCTVPAKSALRG
jgi:hypothetical protein